MGDEVVAALEAENRKLVQENIALRTCLHWIPAILNPTFYTTDHGEKVMIQITNKGTSYVFSKANDFQKYMTLYTMIYLTGGEDSIKAHTEDVEMLESDEK